MGDKLHNHKEINEFQNQKFNPKKKKNLKKIFGTLMEVMIFWMNSLSLQTKLIKDNPNQLIPKISQDNLKFLLQQIHLINEIRTTQLNHLMNQNSDNNNNLTIFWLRVIKIVDQFNCRINKRRRIYWIHRLIFDLTDYD